MAGPTVKLTFAGDSASAVKAMDKVGDSADSVDRRVRASGEGFDRAGDSIDGTGQKAGDLESGFRGITDSAAGFAQIAQGDVMAGLTDLAGGAEALAFGLRGVVVPALKSGVLWLRGTRVGTLAMAAASRVAAAAQLVMAAGMRVLNAVMRMNPIVRIVALVTLLGGAFLWLWNRSETLRNVVRAVWRAITAAVRASVNWIRGAIKWVWHGLVDGINWVYGKVKAVLNAIVGAARWVADQVRSIWESISGGAFTSSAAAALNRARAAAGKLPKRHEGGTVPGAPGQEVNMTLMAGERVTRAGASNRTATLRSDGSAFSNLVLETVRKAVRQQGGDVQIVLGRGL